MFEKVQHLQSHPEEASLNLAFGSLGSAATPPTTVYIFLPSLEEKKFVSGPHQWAESSGRSGILWTKDASKIDLKAVHPLHSNLKSGTSACLTPLISSVLSPCQRFHLNAPISAHRHQLQCRPTLCSHPEI